MDPSSSPSQEFALNAFCTRCGYDLRSNNVAGPCPKCGLALAYASVNSELSLAHPLWLQRLVLGITGVAIAQLFFVLESIWNLLVLLGNLAGAGIDAWIRVYEIALGVEWFAILFLLAAPQNEEQRKEDWSSPRKLLRVITGAYVAVYLLYGFLRNTPTWYANATWLLLTATQFALVAVLFVFLIRLARQTGEAMFRHHFPICLTLMLMSLGFSFLVSLREVMNPSGRFYRMDSVQYLVAIAAESYFIWLLWHLRKSIAAIFQSRRAAEDTGNQPDAA